MAKDSMQARINAAKEAELLAWSQWEAFPVPVGTLVSVTKDDGSRVVTKTRSNPWKLGGGTPVVMVEGISGGYLLTRVHVLPPSAPPVSGPSR